MIGKYARSVAGRVRNAIDQAQVPLMLVADVLELSLPEVRDRYDGTAAWNLDQLELVAALTGESVWAILRGAE